MYPPRGASAENIHFESPWVSFRFFLLEDGTMTNPYPAEFRERALRMLAEVRADHPSDFAVASHVAGRLRDPEAGERDRRRGAAKTPSSCS